MKIGDVVTFKSGGAKMTIIRINPDSVACAWFETEKQQINAFPKEALMIIDQNPSIDKKKE